VSDTVRVRGLDLHVRRAGTGPPLLLINGIGAALEMLEPLTSRLHGHETIAFDLPGCGRSSLPRRPLCMRELADLCRRLIDALGHDRVDVLGYSFGGAVAQELAYRAPDRVRRRVRCGSTPGLPALPPGPRVLAMMLTPARYYSRGLGAYIVPRIAGGRTARDPAALAENLEHRQRHPPSLLGYSYQLGAITGWTSQPWLRRIQAETLVLHGDDDPIAPLLNARWMTHLIPSARLRVIPGAGHLFLLDEPTIAPPLIRSFLTGAQSPTRRTL
jgi:poly(3-hydroxyalkanoate) depolymerase